MPGPYPPETDLTSDGLMEADAPRLWREAGIRPPGPVVGRYRHLEWCGAGAAVEDAVALCETGDSEGLRSWIEGHQPASLDVPDSRDFWPLATAVFHGHAAVVALLVQRDLCDPACAGHRKRSTPLHVAAYRGQTSLIPLLATPAALRAIDAWGRTALHQASHHGHVDTVRALVRAGADRSAVDRWGNMPGDLASCPKVQGVLAEDPYRAWLRDWFASMDPNLAPHATQELRVLMMRSLDDVVVDPSRVHEALDRLIGQGEDPWKTQWASFVAGSPFIPAFVTNPGDAGSE